MKGAWIGEIPASRWELPPQSWWRRCCFSGASTRRQLLWRREVYRTYLLLVVFFFQWRRGPHSTRNADQEASTFFWSSATLDQSQSSPASRETRGFAHPKPLATGVLDPPIRAYLLVVANARG
jgi:hypothetical protein